jgi:rRNA small subunit pseudouridine methyltransferase Nep1
LKLNVVLAEAALELAPRETWRSPAVASDARKRELPPGQILLDRSFHQSSMSKLEGGLKRGRPDLVHAALLSVSSTPVYLDGLVKVYVHTFPDVVLEIKEGTRIPKSYLRFRGLVEKALSTRADTEFLQVYDATMQKLVRKVIRPDFVSGLSTQGRSLSLSGLADTLVARKNPCVIVGGFSRGHFSRGTLELVDELVRIHERPLDAHVVLSRILYEVENRLRTSIND